MKDESGRATFCLLWLVLVICVIALPLHLASFAVESVLTIKEEGVVLGKPLAVEVPERWGMLGLVNASVLLISQECLTNHCCYWLARRHDGLSFVDSKISEDQVFNLR